MPSKQNLHQCICKNILSFGDDPNLRLIIQIDNASLIIIAIRLAYTYSPTPIPTYASGSLAVPGSVDTLPLVSLQQHRTLVVLLYSLHGAPGLLLLPGAAPGLPAGVAEALLAEIFGQLQVSEVRGHIVLTF